MSDEFRQARASELTELAELLSRADLGLDTSPIQRAARQCAHRHTGGDWGYDLNGLLLPLDHIAKTIPRELFDPTIELNVSLRAQCIDSHSGAEALWDSYQLELIARGVWLRGDQEEDALSAWHVDLDLPPSTDGKQSYIHPTYHMQFGGRRVRHAMLDFGSTIILDPPRIAHPPMDAILAVDWVLTNYFEADRLKFRSERDYADLIEAASDRFLRPYAASLFSYFPLGAVRPAVRLWPQLHL